MHHLIFFASQMDMDRKNDNDSQSEVPNPPVLQFPHCLQSVVSQY
jgi:hypothetical protein